MIDLYYNIIISASEWKSICNHSGPPLSRISFVILISLSHWLLIDIPWLFWNTFSGLYVYHTTMLYDIFLLHLCQLENAIHDYFIFGDSVVIILYQLNSCHKTHNHLTDSVHASFIIIEKTIIWSRLMGPARCTSIQLVFSCFCTNA